MPELEVVGSPEMCNIAFKSRMKAVDVYKVRPLTWRLQLSAVDPSVAYSACRALRAQMAMSSRQW